MVSMRAMTDPPRSTQRSDADGRSDLLHRLRAGGAQDADAIRELRELMVRAARHQAARTPHAHARLGRAAIEDAIVTAANEATMAVLARLDTFEGRSRFTTWAFKFGILHTAAELRRANWRDVDIDLAALAEPVSASPGPEQYAESADLVSALHIVLDNDLTSYQRSVAVALLVENVPIDVLAERLGSTRNALYKTLHDARKKIRSGLIRRGYLDGERGREEVMA